MLIFSCVQVWDDSSSAIADFVGVDVDQVIEPSSATVALGSIICFACPLRSAEGIFAFSVIN